MKKLFTYLVIFFILSFCVASSETVCKCTNGGKCTTEKVCVIKNVNKCIKWKTATKCKCAGSGCKCSCKQK